MGSTRPEPQRTKTRKSLTWWSRLATLKTLISVCVAATVRGEIRWIQSSAGKLWILRFSAGSAAQVPSLSHITPDTHKHEGHMANLVGQIKATANFPGHRAVTVTERHVFRMPDTKFHQILPVEFFRKIKTNTIFYTYFRHGVFQNFPCFRITLRDYLFRKCSTSYLC